MELDCSNTSLRQKLIQWLSKVYDISKGGLRKEFIIPGRLVKYNREKKCSFLGEEFILPWLRFAFEDKVNLIWTMDMGIGLVAAKDLICPSGANQSPTIVPGNIDKKHILPGYAFRVGRENVYGTITGPASLANAACALHSKALFTRTGSLKLKKGVKIKKGEQIFVKYGQRESGDYMTFLQCPFCSQ